MDFVDAVLTFSSVYYQEAHQWLTLAQLSPQAWSFSWELIVPDKQHEVQFFGASCLAVKVKVICDTFVVHNNSYVVPVIIRCRDVGEN